jgi:hypothetical protein
MTVKEAICMDAEIMSPEKRQYVAQRRPLFWSVGDDKLHQISDELLVETILNYGTLEDVRALIALMGLKQVAFLFSQTYKNRSRHNYFPQVANFFDIYFSRHAPGYPL